MSEDLVLLGSASLVVSVLMVGLLGFVLVRFFRRVDHYCQNASGSVEDRDLTPREREIKNRLVNSWSRPMELDAHDARQ